MKILAFSDIDALLSQIVSRFRDTGEVHAVTSNPEFAKKFGPAKVLTVKPPILSDSLAAIITDLQKKDPYDLIVIGTSVRGREIAGMLSFNTGLHAISEVNNVTPENGTITSSRFFYGGKSLITEKSGAKILVSAPGIAEATEKAGNPPVEELSLGKSKVSVEGTIEKKSGSVDIEKAGVIVSVGRGLGNKENLSKIEPFARAIHGEIAGSRPVCLDYGWLSEDRQVGLSGKKVQPKLYVALGISGQIQHIAGMRNSKVVVAVNKDKSAPIFEEADYGVVGDMFTVVQKLTEKVSS
ncbi:MAG: electron transfer flavoprotein subunit alpha/FixB family protein [Candidatus Thermoplasmatota archaeon]|nr:electron transfer flavoprotein subunit alpha/FixB family protein [Candidatus Thermoplasmatota archaeon]